ncbi:DUF2336 domain-containing protein [Parvibaculaceae bacterium PLY_AMNH_Bact1]|nr:DUF2336 domain-containing protein [Parvibaculaceae bacterium PLY_AMNH_Bact1]
MAKDDKSAGSRAEPLSADATGSLDDKLYAAAALGELTVSADLTDDDRRQAHDILATLSLDAEQQVRASVARAIADYPFLPAAVAEKLAADVSDVASPVLERSPVLTDTFLVDLIESGAADEQAQISIATRPDLTEAVSGPLLRTGKRRAVETVLSNTSAKIDDEGYGALFARDDLDGRMLTLVSARQGLSAPVVAQCHKIILTDRFDRAIGMAVRQTLIESHALPPQMADAIVNAAMEDALSRSASNADVTPEELIGLAATLNSHNDLTPSLLLRMTCGGSLDFSMAAFHVLTNRSYDEVARAFHSAGTEVLGDLYLESGLPPYFRFALVAAIKRIAEEHRKPNGSTPEKPVQDIIREIVGFYRGIAPTGLDQVIARLCHEAARWSEDDSAAPSSA